MFRGFRLAPHAEGEPRPSAGSASVSEFAANRRGKRFWHRLLPLRLSLVVAFALAGEAAWGADFVRFEIDSTPRTGEWYAIGETIEVQAVFDSAVQAGTAPATTLTLTIGDMQRIASIVGDNQGTTIEFHYQVVDGDNDTNGIEIMAGAFQGGDFTDVDDGTTVDVMNAALSQQSNHRVDGVRQAVTAVKLVNPPRSGTYIRGDNIDVAVEFDGRVHVRGQPYLQLSIGPESRRARYISGHQTDTLLFRYPVQDDDLDEDGIQVAPGALLQDGTITDPVGNPVDRALGDLDPDDRLVDAVSQRVLSVVLTTDPGSDNTYGIDDYIEVEVEFDDIVRVSGAPELVLSLGANGGTIPGPQTQRAGYVSGDETDTLLFRYRVQEGDFDENGVSIDPNALMGGSIKDAAGNDVRRELPLSLTFPNHQVDGIRPAAVRGVEIISTPASGDTYTRGEAITLELTFGETVHLTGGPGNPVLLISIGRHTRRQAEYDTGGGSPKLRFEYIVQADDEDTDGISVGPDALCWLDNDGDGELCDVPDQLEDAAGNPVSRRIIPIGQQSNHKVDGGLANPTATGARILSQPPPGQDGFYRLGDELRVAVDFNVPVHVRGDVQLTIAIGGRSAAADLVQGSGTTSLVFRYIVQAGDYDDDGISIGPNALVGGTIEASTGNAARRVFVELPPQNGHRVDAVPPGAAQVAIRPAGPYGLGEPINITVELNEVVYVTQDAADDPLSLLLSIGERNRRASYFSGSGSTELEFRYIVRRGDYDDDGISIGPDALVGGVIEDRAGNEWGEDERRLTPFPRNSRYRVDARREDDGAPQIKDVDFLDPSDRYGIGDKIEVQVEFYETVYVSGTPLPMLLLDIGRAQRRAELVDGSGSSRLIFAYTVQAGDLDTDGVSVGPDALVGGKIVDATGNNALREYEPLPAEGSPLVRVDGLAPRVVEVDFDSRPRANDEYRIGETIRVVVQFNEPVHVTETGSELRLVLSIGEHSRHADYVTGSGNRDGALVFQYTVQTGDFDGDGISIGPDALVGGLVEDVVGNDWDESERRLPATGEDNKHMVNGGGGLVVTVANVKISSEPADGPYRLGEAIEVRIEFTQVVHVMETEGQLELLLSIGEHLRRAAYVEGSGTMMLLFRYVVQDGDFDSDGISIGADALVGGSVQTEAGVPAQRAFLAEEADPGHKVDARRPTVKEDGVEISSEPADGPYRLGEAIEVRIEFTQVVHVVEADDELELLLSIGEHTRNAAYVEGSGTETLLFRYVVQDGDFDDDGVSIGTGALVGGSVQTESGSPVQRALPAAIGADPEHRVNARRPTVKEDGVKISSEPADGWYHLGDAIDVRIEFTDVVHVVEADDELELLLAIGEHTRSAAYVEGSGTETLRFRYVVQDGDFDDDGVSIGADALVGGSVQTESGSAVQRALPEAIQADRGHRVDARRPTVNSVEIVPKSTAGPYRLGEAIDVRIEFTDAVHVVEASGELELLLSIGEHTRRAGYVEGSGTTQLLFRYVVQDGDFDSDGVSIGAGALVGGLVQTEFGNPAQREFDALPADDSHQVDARRPTVRTARISTEPFRGDTYRVGERIEVEVEFTEAVTPSREQDVELQLTIGSEQKGAPLCGDDDDGRTLIFCYDVELGDEDANGIAIAADALTGGEILDGHGNVAAREIAALADQSQHKVDGSPLGGTLAVTLTTADGPREQNLRDVLTALGIGFNDAFAQPINTDPSVVAANLAGQALVLTPVAEGTAQVRVTDGDCGLADETCAITLDFLVTVQANQAEVAVLQQALAAVGRGLLAGAANTIGARLEMGGYGPHFSVGGRRIAPLGLDAATSNMANNDLAGSDPFHPWRGASDPMRSAFPNDGGWSNGGHRAGAALGSSRLLHGTAFEMPLVGGPKRNSSWAMWGAADFQSFSGNPEGGGYDGSMSTAYLGVDGRGDAWVAGASVSRTRAESDYDFESQAGTDNATSGKGTMSTDLTVFHPYAQWSLGEKGRAWVMGGFGTGEAELEREGAASPQPSDMAVTMGMAGVRVELGRPGGVDFALRGDVGTAQLETKDGLGALDELQVSAQRARIGLETSLPLVVEDGSALTPFLDVGARVDGGDGQTGTGVEVAAGIRFGGKSVRFEAKGRTLVMHEGETDDDYSETGGSATLMVAPGANGRGLSLSLSPRWGASADSTDQLWRNNAPVSARDIHQVDTSWGVAGRIGYGLPMKQRQGTVTPFGEVNVAGEEQQRTKVGIRYAIDRLGGDSPMRFEFSGERVEREHGAEHRVMFTAEGRF